MEYNKLDYRLIKSILLDPTKTQNVPLDLFRREDRHILKINKQILTKYGKTSLQAVEEVLQRQGAQPQLVHLSNIKGAVDIDEPTYNLLFERQHEWALSQLHVEGTNTVDPMDSSQVLKHYKRTQKLYEHEVEDQLFDSNDFFEFNRLTRPVEETLPTFEFLNGTGGEMFKGALATVFAPSGMGKTAIKTHVTRHLITKGLKVLYLAFEEPIENFNERMIRGLIGKTAHQFKELTDEVKRDLTREFFNKKNIKRGELIVQQHGTLYVEDLPDLIDNLEEDAGFEFDVIVIDYLKHVKLRGAGKNTQEYQEIEEVSRHLKKLAMRPGKRKFVLTGIQANRDAIAKAERGKNPGIEHMAGSLGAARNSDLVLSLTRGLHRDRREGIIASEQVPEDMVNIFKLQVAKKRDGSIGEGDFFYYEQDATNKLQMVIHENDINNMNEYYTPADV